MHYSTQFYPTIMFNIVWFLWISLSWHHSQDTYILCRHASQQKHNWSGTISWWSWKSFKTVTDRRESQICLLIVPKLMVLLPYHNNISCDHNPFRPRKQRNQWSITHCDVHKMYIGQCEENIVKQFTMWLRVVWNKIPQMSGKWFIVVPQLFKCIYTMLKYRYR